MHPSQTQAVIDAEMPPRNTEASPAEARGFHAQRHGHSDRRGASPLSGAFDTGKTASATPSPALAAIGMRFSSSDPL
jgi:hypothetical protein